jgi:hypothetical protein
MEEIIMIDFIGNFYFKQTGNGNLIGEFTNDKMDYILTESCDIKSDDKIITDKFIGKYHSTWQENSKPFYANLNIIYKNETGNKKYILEWKDNFTLKPISSNIQLESIPILKKVTSAHSYLAG